MKKKMTLIVILVMLAAAFSAISAAESSALSFYSNGGEKPLMTEPSNFSEGYAWIFYDNGSDIKRALLVDNQGNIVFRPDGPVCYASEFHDGVAIYTEGEDNPWNSYKDQRDVLIDTQGNEIYRAEGDEYSRVKYESICGYANGYYLIQRDVSGLSDSYSEVGLMNPDGTMAVSYSHDFLWAADWSWGPYSAFVGSHDVGYAGKGWYWIGRTMINFDRHEVGEIHGDVIADFDHFGVLIDDNGMVYDENINYIGPIDFYWEHPKYRELQSDGMFFAMRDYYDIDLNVKLSMENHYPNNEIHCTPFYGKEYALMKIDGQDGYTYLTMIDRNGEELFEPMIVKDYCPEVMDGYAVVSLPRSEDPEIVIIDSKGKVCHSISEDMNWNEIELKECSYSEGWLMIRYTGDGHRRYKLYPLQVAAELGNERYDVGDL